MIDYFLNPQMVEALGWTLLHSLWQGAAFAFSLVIILITLRKYSAKSRYILSVGVLCAFFLTLAGTFWMQWQKANINLDQTTAVFNEADPNFIALKNTTIPLETSNADNVIGEKEVATQVSSSWLVVFQEYYNKHLPLLVTLWLLGILFLQLRLLGQLAYLQRLKHYGTTLFPKAWNEKIEDLEGKLRIRKKISYLTSIRIESPMVIGWLKPVVLIPRQLFNGLTETEMYAVLAHELAHIRREDFIVNLVQTFLCNVFFFHPGVWWMSNRIDEEREHCCDDLAVAATGPVTTYAKTLINVSEYQLQLQKNPSLAMALSRKSKRRERGGFTIRIKRLFEIGQGRGAFREGFSTAFILISALLLGVAATGTTAQSLEEASSENMVETQSLIEKQSEESNDLEHNSIKKIPIVDKAADNKPEQIIEREELPVIAPQPPVAPEEPISPEPPVRLSKDYEDRIDELILACRNGNLKLVQEFVQAGVDINGIGSGRFTALMMATSHDKAEIVEYLIKQGAEVNQSFRGWTALMEAADEQSVKSMMLLLKAGADVNYYKTKGSRTAITMAASEGHLDCLQLLLRYGADMNGVGKSLPPLHMAAEENKGKIVDYLLSKNVNLNEKDADGRTALMYAASEGNSLMVKKLIMAGADIFITDRYGASAKDFAKKEEAYALWDYLKDLEKEFLNKESNSTAQDFQRRDRPTIHQATIDGKIEKVQRMVEQGTDINLKDASGQTPLHIASALGHNIDMRILIDLGADLNAQDGQGRTPMMLAAADGKKNAVVLLVSKRAEVNLKDVDGMSAYDWSKSGGNSGLSNFLELITDKNSMKWEKEDEKRKAQQNKTNQRKSQKSDNVKETLHKTNEGVHLRQFDIEERNSKLLELARTGTIEELTELLSKGISVNATDATGQTALMVAAHTNRINVVKFLIKEGADVNKSSASGLTALHYTALENHDRIARVLLENNAKIDPAMRYSSTDGNYTKEPLVWEYIGATPLLIAVESGNIKVIKVLIQAGANKEHQLTRNEYKLNKNRVNYLHAGEVMGVDKEFLKEVEFQKTNYKWTPHQHAKLLNKPAILTLFEN